MSGSNSDFLMQSGSGGVYNFSAIPFQLKDTFLTKSGLKIWEFYVDSTLSRTIYYGLPGYDYINFQGKLIENVSDKSYNYYVGNDRWSYYYGQYKSSSRYLGTGQKEAVWLYPNGWGKDQVNFISGAGNNDIAIIPQKINDITSLVTNSLGFTRLETFYAVYIIAGVNELHFLDTSISLNSQTPGTSAVKVVKGGYNMDNDLGNQYRSAGPGKAILTTDNSDNVVFVMHSGPGDGGKLSVDHLPSYDFYKGTDTLLMPNWNSSEVNFKKVGSEWIMLGSGFSPTYSNLEYVQFKDKGIKLNSDGTIQDILFTDIGASPTPTPTPTYTLTPSASSISEGTALTTTVDTTNVASGTTLYYSLTGTGINPADFSSGSLTGSGTVSSSGSFSFSHTLANDLTTEGTETLNIKLFSDASRLQQIGSTTSVSISDTSKATNKYVLRGNSLYTIANDTSGGRGANGWLSARSNAQALGGDLVVFETREEQQDILKLLETLPGGEQGLAIGMLVTGGSPRWVNGLNLTYEHWGNWNPTNILDGYVGMLASYSGGNERYWDASRNGDWGWNGIAEIPLSNFSVTPSATSINEGSALTTSVATISGLSGTTLYYSLSGTGITAADFSAGSLTGSGSVASDGSFSFSHTLTNDLTTEGTETLNIKLFSDASRLQQIGSTTSVSISDTSTTLGIPTARTVDNLYAKALIAGPLLQTNIVGNQIDYQFYNIGAERYGIRQKESTRIDEITGLASISISGTTISISQDIQGVFDQVTGRETQDAQAFRLYNAAFARFPDSSGLRYWINEYKSGISNYRTIAQSFINSNEFALRYGANNSNEEFINNMYKNVLGRLPDASGLAYWVGNLNSGADSRVNVLGGFSESAENKILFSQGTGFI
jgi:Domain of unknown function (DUF4214)